MQSAFYKHCAVKGVIHALHTLHYLYLMDLDVDIEFKALVKELEKTAGSGLDLEAIIFMIGMQELGFGYRKFSKDEKLNVMHVAVSTILEPYGYYEYVGRDEDGWPHFKTLKKLPNLSGPEQQKALKRAVIDYFRY